MGLNGSKSIVTCLISSTDAATQETLIQHKCMTRDEDLLTSVYIRVHVETNAYE